MRPYQLIFDAAVRDPWSLRHHATGLSYRGEIGPDGVTYPNISTAVPDETRAEVAALLAEAIGHPIDVTLTFFRLSLGDTVAPHWAHTDRVISDYLALLYLSFPSDCRGGTAIVEHVSGMKRHPTDPLEQAIWSRDTNDQDAWETVTLAPMAFNRLVVLPSDVFHAATPQGFGSTAKNGRLVLITFFSKKE